MSEQTRLVDADAISAFVAGHLDNALRKGEEYRAGGLRSGEQACNAVAIAMRQVVAEVDRLAAGSPPAAVPTWRPASEPPEHNHDVVAFDVHGHKRIDWFDGATWTNAGVTHWIEPADLPSPPEAGE